MHKFLTSTSIICDLCLVITVTPLATSAFLIVPLSLRIVQIVDFAIPNWVARSETWTPFSCLAMIYFLTSIMILVFFLFTLQLSLSFFGPMVSYLIIYKKTQNTLKFKRRHSEFEWTKATQQLTLSPIGVADSGYFPLDHSSMNTDTPSLSLHDVDGLRVHNSRHSTSSEMLCVQKICS